MLQKEAMLIRENDFRRLFAIPESERLMMIETVMFQIRGFLHMNGFAYLTTSMFCLEGTVFGAQALFCIHYNLFKSKCELFEASTNTVRIGLDLPEIGYIDLSFSEFDNYDIFMELFSSLIEEKHHWNVPNSSYPSCLVSKQRPNESKLEVPPSLDANMILLLREAKIVIYERGDVLIAEGSNSRRLIQILHGTAQIVKGIGMDKSILAQEHPGSVLGYQSLVLGTLSSASFEVASDFLYAVEIDYSSLSVALDLNDVFCAKFYHAIAKSVAHRFEVAFLRFVIYFA